MPNNRNKTGIPTVPTAAGKAGLADILGALKDNVEIMTGARDGPIVVLPPDATLPQVVAKLNEVIRRINF